MIQIKQSHPNLTGLLRLSLQLLRNRIKEHAAVFSAYPLVLQPANLVIRFEVLCFSPIQRMLAGRSAVPCCAWQPIASTKTAVITENSREVRTNETWESSRHGSNKARRCSIMRNSGRSNHSGDTSAAIASIVA
jgi:hypothetical protein